MVVTYRCESGVTWVRHVHTVADVDAELRAAAALLAFHTGPARRHPSSPRQAAQLRGLVDVLLEVRGQVADAEVLAGVDPFGQMPSFEVSR